MMSKNSFLVNITKNLRRRIWLIVIQMLVLFFSLPIASILATGAYGDEYSAQYLQIVRTFAFDQAIGLGGIHLYYISAILAAYAAIQGFSYMFSKSKLDFYMSAPVNKNIRFWTIYFNGILVFTISYLINLAISVIAACSSFVQINSILQSVLAQAGLIFVIYFSVYNISILVIMITGKCIITGLGIVTVMMYPLFVIFAIAAYCESFFASYYCKTSEIFYNFDWSPLNMIVIAQSKCVSVDWLYYKLIIKDTNLLWNAAIKSLIVGVIALIIGKYAYNRKPSENCGKPIVFKTVEPVVKILLTSLCSIAFGIFFYKVTGSDNSIFLILGITIGVLFGHALMQVLINLDLRAVLKGHFSLITSVVIVVCFVCLFKFDWIGFDSYIPASNEMESAGIDSRFSWNANYYNEKMDYVDSFEYIEDNMHLTCYDSISALMAKRMPGLNGTRTNSPEQTDALENCTVIYHLKNGKTKYRSFQYNVYEDEDIMNSILKDEEFYKGFSPIYNEIFTQCYTKPETKLFVFKGLANINASNIDIPALMKVYAEDYSKLTFSDMLNKNVIGMFAIEYQPFGGQYMANDFPIYDNFTQTISMLKEYGFEPGYNCDTKDITSIQITNYHDELCSDTELLPGEDASNYTVEMTVTDPKQIEELMKVLYPSTLSSFWAPGDRFSISYYVEVKTGTDSGDYGEMYMPTYSYEFFSNNIPDFVEEGTKYVG